MNPDSRSLTRATGGKRSPDGQKNINRRHTGLCFHRPKHLTHLLPGHSASANVIGFRLVGGKPLSLLAQARVNNVDIPVENTRC